MKQNIRSNNLKIVITLLLVSTLFTYCAPKHEVIKKVDEQETLRSRVQEYWLYQINGNADKAYQYEIPAYREKVSPAAYLNRYKGIRYLEANLLKVEMNGSEAKASVNVTYVWNLKYISEVKTVRTEEENWVKLENIWYHIPEGFQTEK